MTKATKITLPTLNTLEDMERVVDILANKAYEPALNQVLKELVRMAYTLGGIHTLQDALEKRNVEKTSKR